MRQRSARKIKIVLKLALAAGTLTAMVPGPTAVRIIEFRRDLEPSPRFRERMISLGRRFAGFTVNETLSTGNIPSAAIQGFEVTAKNLRDRPIRTWSFLPGKKAVALTFRPGTYESPVAIRIRYTCPSGICSKSLLTRKYAHPAPELAKEIPIVATGNFSVDYVMINLGIGDNTNDFASYFPAVINKHGEIVWAHLPTGGKKLFPGYWTTRDLGQGLVALMAPRLHSYAEIFSLDAGVISSIDAVSKNPEIFFHHDIEAGRRADRLIYLGNARKTLSNCRDLIAELNGKSTASGTKDPCSATPLAVMATTIEELDFKTGAREILWDPFKFLSFKNHPDLAAESSFRIAPGLDLQKMLHWLPLMSVPYNQHQSVHTDWMHGNSLNHVPGKGYLLSGKNFSRVFMISPDFKKILWTVGPAKHDTFQVNGDAKFDSQHHVTMNGRGNLMLFDNQTTPGGLIGTSLDRSRVIEFELKNGKATVAWSFTPDPIISSPIRGSAYELDNGNVLSFFPERNGAKEYILEVARPGKLVLGKITIDHRDRFLGYRALPFTI